MGLRTWLSDRIRARPLGQRGEDAAARFLQRMGYRILARQVDSPLGELDIIAVDGRTIVFVEVKTRTSDDAGHAAEAIDQRKQRRMTNAALAYLKSHRLLNYSTRFDVVAILWPSGATKPSRVDHVKNAFEASGRGQFFC